MMISSHLKKIERFEAAMASLDPIEDFELWFWSVMVSGTNAVNAALHLVEVTPAEHAYPSQPGLYYVPDGSDYKPILKKLGDVLHVGRPAIEAPVPPDVHQMMEAMEKIETYRDPCTRGGMVPTPEIVKTCEEAYRDCMQILHKRLSEHQS